MWSVLAQLNTGGAGDVTEAVKQTFSANQVLSPYMPVLLVAFVVSLIMTPIMRKLAMANGIVDWPDLKRKQHIEPVAYLGGVAVFVGWLLGVIVCFFLTPHTAVMEQVSASSVQFPMSIIVGAGIICLVGVIDDVYGISPRVKVGGQLLAAALLAKETVGTQLASGAITALFVNFGFDPHIIPGFGAHPVYYDPSYWIGAGLVAFLVLGACNATNLLDGLDGLASGVTGVITLGFLFIATALAMGLYGPGGAYSPFNDPVRIVMCLAMLGAILGFLPYNFNPANIFMGDAGSLLLGYLSVTTILLFAEKGDPTLVMAGLIVFAVPILDTSLAIVRRKMRGQPIFSPDSQHLHHQLIRSGLSVKQAVFALYGIALAFAVVGSSMIFLRLRFVGPFFLVIFSFITVTAYKVGHRQYLAQQIAEKAKADLAAAASSAGDIPSPNAPTPATTSGATPAPTSGGNITAGHAHP